MLTRPSPECVIDNPLIESPFNAQYEIGLGSFPINNDWLTLEGPNFSTLEGPNFAFLGP